MEPSSSQSSLPSVEQSLWSLSSVSPCTLFSWTVSPNTRSLTALQWLSLKQPLSHTQLQSPVKFGAS